MTALGGKTPVSMLQEYLVSKGMAMPIYEVTRDGTRQQHPEFTFRVRVGPLYEEGSGRSKQVAKHRAAEKMLNLIKRSSSGNDSAETVEVLSESLIGESTYDNYVGQLKEYVATHHYPEPRYYVEEAAGPPHSRIFKMICSVSKLQEFGIATTKKQAKHQAAYSMLERLKELGKNVLTEELDILMESRPKILHIPQVSLTDDEIESKYNAAKTTLTQSVRDPAVLYQDHYRAYESLEETSQTLQGLVKDDNLVDINNALSLVKQIAKELMVELSVTEVNTEIDHNFLIMSLSVSPPIAGIGLSEEESAVNLLNTILFFLTE